MNMTETTISILVACIAATASIVSGMITNCKSIRDLKKDMDSTKELLNSTRELLGGDISSTKELLSISITEKSTYLENTAVKESNCLSKEHDNIIQMQNQVLYDTRKISDYVARQDGYARSASERNIDLNNLFSQIKSLAKKVDEADSERKQMLKERNNALAEKTMIEKELEKVRLETSQQIADLKSELNQAYKQLLEANRAISYLKNSQERDTQDFGDLDL